MLIIRQRIAVLGLATAALLLAACQGTAVPAPTETAQPPTSAPTTAPATAVPTALYPEVPRVSVEEAKSAFDAGSAIFVDVSSPEIYGAEHIPGAINIPNWETEARMGELDKQEWIIPYCT